MSITIKELLASDSISDLVNKINSNFDQILLNGGGPIGITGRIGGPGPKGAQGFRGTQWFTGTLNPSELNPPLNPDLLLDKDLYLQSNGDIWEYIKKDDGSLDPSANNKWSNTGISIKGEEGSPITLDIRPGGITIGSEGGTAPYDGHDFLFLNESRELEKNLGIHTRAMLIGGYPDGGIGDYPINTDYANAINSNTGSLFIHSRSGASKHIVFSSGVEETNTTDIAFMPSIRGTLYDSLEFYAPRKLKDGFDEGLKFLTDDSNIDMFSNRDINIETQSNPLTTSTESGLFSVGNVNITATDRLDDGGQSYTTPNAAILSNVAKEVINDKLEIKEWSRIYLGGSDNGLKNDQRIIRLGVGDGLTGDTSTGITEANYLNTAFIQVGDKDNRNIILHSDDNIVFKGNNGLYDTEFVFDTNGCIALGTDAIGTLSSYTYNKNSRTFIIKDTITQTTDINALDSGLIIDRLYSITNNAGIEAGIYNNINSNVDASSAKLIGIYNKLSHDKTGTTINSLIGTDNNITLSNGTATNVIGSNVYIKSNALTTPTNIYGININITRDRNAHIGDSVIGLRIGSFTDYVEDDNVIGIAQVDGIAKNYLRGNTGLGVAISKDNIEATLHIKKNNLTNFYRDQYASQIIESQDARLEIASDDEGSYGSGLILSNVNSDKTNKWSLHHKIDNSIRLTYLGDIDNKSTNAFTGSDYLVISKTGNVSIGPNAQAGDSPLEIYGDPAILKYTNATASNSITGGNRFVRGSVEVANIIIEHVGSGANEMYFSTKDIDTTDSTTVKRVTIKQDGILSFSKTSNSVITVDQATPTNGANAGEDAQTLYVRGGQGGHGQAGLPAGNIQHGGNGGDVAIVGGKPGQGGYRDTGNVFIYSEPDDSAATPGNIYIGRGKNGYGGNSAVGINVSNDNIKSAIHMDLDMGDAAKRFMLLDYNADSSNPLMMKFRTSSVTGDTHMKAALMVEHATSNGQNIFHIALDPSTGNTNATKDDSKFAVKYDGTVGINVPNPTESLDIYRDTTSQQVVTRYSNKNTPSGKGILVGMSGDGKGIIWNRDTRASNGDILIAPGASEKVRFMQNGNVAIGKTSTNSKLGVSGGVSIGSNIATGSARNGELLVEYKIGIGELAPVEDIVIKRDNPSIALDATGEGTAKIILRDFDAKDSQFVDLSYSSASEVFQIDTKNGPAFNLNVNNGTLTLMGTTTGTGKTTINQSLSVLDRLYLGGNSKTFIDHFDKDYLGVPQRNLAIGTDSNISFVLNVGNTISINNSSFSGYNTPHTWNFNAGSDSSYADLNFGSGEVNGDFTVSGQTDLNDTTVTGLTATSTVKFTNIPDGNSTSEALTIDDNGNVVKSPIVDYSLAYNREVTAAESNTSGRDNFWGNSNWDDFGTEYGYFFNNITNNDAHISYQQYGRMVIVDAGYLKWDDHSSNTYIADVTGKLPLPTDTVYFGVHDRNGGDSQNWTCKLERGTGNLANKAYIRVLARTGSSWPYDGRDAMFQQFCYIADADEVVENPAPSTPTMNGNISWDSSSVYNNQSAGINFNMTSSTTRTVPVRVEIERGTFTEDVYSGNVSLTADTPKYLSTDAIFPLEAPGGTVYARLYVDGSLKASDTITWYDYTEPSSGGGGGCLATDTLITLYSAMGAVKIPMDELKVGDQLLSYNIPGLPDDTEMDNVKLWKSDNLDSAYLTRTTVKSVRADWYKEHYVINNSIKATYEHLFLVKDPENNWSFKMARDLQPGYILKDEQNNEVEITNVEFKEERLDVITIDVENVDTYFANGILAHNPIEEKMVEDQNDL